VSVAVTLAYSELEGAEATLLSASGMCAATTMLLAPVPEGGHIVTTTDCYRRTRQFIQTMLPKMGITVLSIHSHTLSYSLIISHTLSCSPILSHTLSYSLTLCNVT